MSNETDIKKVTKRISNVSEKLDLVFSLFNKKPDLADANRIVFQGVTLETIVDCDTCQIMMANYKEKGMALPMHTHKGSVEYLIAIQGRALLQLPENRTRIMEQSECASIPSGVDHTTVSMDDDAKILAICIPAEIAYKKVEDGNY